MHPDMTIQLAHDRIAELRASATTRRRRPGRTRNGSPPWERVWRRSTDDVQRFGRFVKRRARGALQDDIEVVDGVHPAPSS